MARVRAALGARPRRAARDHGRAGNEDRRRRPRCSARPPSRPAMPPVGINRPPRERASDGGRARVRRERVRWTTSRPYARSRAWGWISTGRSVPTRPRGRHPGQRHFAALDNLPERGLGLHATARVRGDLVTIEISARQQSLRPDAAAGAHLGAPNTVVTARLGRWIEIGATRTTGGSSDGNLLRWAATRPRVNTPRGSGWTTRAELRSAGRRRRQRNLVDPARACTRGTGSTAAGRSPSRVVPTPFSP